MTTQNPLVSIVIPFHEKYTQYLEQCLNSVREQTCANWEVVLVDDASGDPDVARRMVESAADARIRLIRHDRNCGQAAGRNTGIRASRGRLIMPLDCDDVLAPTHLEKLVAALESRPDCGAAYADYHLFPEPSRDVQFPVRDTAALLQEQWIPHPGTLYRRSLWEQSGGYCEEDIFRQGNEDWDFWLSAAEVGFAPIRIAEPLYFYRQHADSVTVSSQSRCAEHLTREVIYARHRALFDRFGMKWRFLSRGYQASGLGHWRNGEHWRALTLLWRSFWMCPSQFVTVSARYVLRVLGAGRTAEART